LGITNSRVGGAIDRAVPRKSLPRLSAAYAPELLFDTGDGFAEASTIQVGKSRSAPLQNRRQKQPSLAIELRGASRNELTYVQYLSTSVGIANVFEHRCQCDQVLVEIRCKQSFVQDISYGMTNQSPDTPPGGTTTSTAPPVFAPMPGAARLIAAPPFWSVPPMIQSA